MQNGSFQNINTLYNWIVDHVALMCVHHFNVASGIDGANHKYSMYCWADSKEHFSVIIYSHPPMPTEKSGEVFFYFTKHFSKAFCWVNDEAGDLLRTLKNTQKNP